MPSLPRQALLEDNSTFHVTWQCHNQDWLLESSWAKQIYYNLLLKYKDRYGIEFYSYCLMDNHIHLSGRFGSLSLFSDFFRVVNSSFARIYNKEKRRRGQVVMDRFKSPRIQTDEYLLNVMLYIDLNPKRAGKVSHPRNNLFSSYAYYAQGAEDRLIRAAPWYLGLGKTEEERQKAYQRLVEDILKNDWKETRPYSSVPFIGNPDWVRKKTEKLLRIRQEQRQRWKVRYREKFGSINRV